MRLFPHTFVLLLPLLTRLSATSSESIPIEVEGGAVLLATAGSAALHLIGPYPTLLYFPMQKVLKIKLRMSSVVVAPVISSSGRRAP